MKNLRLLTWLDVRKIISRKTNYGTNLPEGVARMDSFSNALEIGLYNDKSIDNVKIALKEWFGDSYREDQSIIQLDLGNETLSVEFSSGNLDPVVVEKLQVRATSRGRSLLEEVKVIVEEAIQYENTPAPQLYRLLEKAYSLNLLSFLSFFNRVFVYS